MKKLIYIKIAAIIARILLGLVFVVFGSNAFLNFMKMPPPSGLAGDFFKAIYASHYFYVVAAIEVLGGAILLSGRYVALGLTLLGPVIVNILCFHIFLNPEGLPLALVVAALEGFLVWQNRGAFAGILAK
jgi:putative oxidoreductase